MLKSKSKKHYGNGIKPYNVIQHVLILLVSCQYDTNTTDFMFRNVNPRLFIEFEILKNTKHGKWYIS